MAKRVHALSGAKTNKEDYHGGGLVERVSPDITDPAKVAGGVKSANFYLTFEEALKLSLALQSCLQSLGRYDRGSRAGKDMGVELSYKSGNRRIAVNEKSVQPQSKTRGRHRGNGQPGERADNA
jgi:hypothetical protein